MIKAKSVRYSKVLAINRNRIGGDLVKKLEEARRGGIAPSVLAAKLTFDQHSNAMHEGCAVRATMRALRNKERPEWRNEGTKPALTFCGVYNFCKGL